MVTSRYFSSQKDIVKASTNQGPLRRGSKGEGVRRLQVTLSTTGCRLPRSMLSGGGFDGIYGREVVDCVTNLQVARHLKRDGIAGREVLGSLDRDLIQLERDLESLARSIPAMLGAFDPRFLKPYPLSPDDLSTGNGVKDARDAKAAVARIEAGFTAIAERSAGRVRYAALGGSKAYSPHGSVQFAAAPLAIPAVVAAAIVALEQAAVAMIALLALVAVCWALSVVIPKVIEEIQRLWVAAMAELAEAVSELAAIVRASLEAFGKCGHLLKDLLQTLVNLMNRGKSQYATKVIRPNGGTALVVPDKNVLKGMKDLLEKAADLLESLTTCLMTNGLGNSEAFRTLMAWATKFRELSAKIGPLKKPIGKLW